MNVYDAAADDDEDEYISVFSFFLLLTWTQRSVSSQGRREEAFEERGAFRRSERIDRKPGEQTHINTSHEPQITSKHHKYLRRLFYVLFLYFIVSFLSVFLLYIKISKLIEEEKRQRDSNLRLVNSK